MTISLSSLSLSRDCVHPFPQADEADQKRLAALAQKAEVNEKKRTALNDTGAHVLKAAVLNVFPESTLTTDVSFSTASKGTLQVRFTPAEKPTDEQLDQIARAANDLIARALPVTVSSLPRAAATAFFDEIPPPADLDPVPVVLIDGGHTKIYAGKHVANTSELKGLKVLKIKHRPKQQQLDIDYGVNEGTTCLR